MTRLLKITVVCQGASMLFYPAALPLSRQTLSYTASAIRRHRRQIGSAWRKLNPGQQALLVLAYLRKGETFADLAAGFGVGTATAWRYVTGTVALLAARSLTAARTWGIVRHLAAGLVTLGDKGYHGAGDHILTPYKGKNKPASQKDANRAHAKLRGPGERANAQLKSWRILRAKLSTALARATKAGHAYVVIDGTLALEGRTTGQSHPHPSGAPVQRMKTLSIF